MAVTYKAILWNNQKKKYDLILWGIILLILLVYTLANLILHPTITPETLIIRGTALAAIIVLHIILMIGPLSRLDKRFLPVLYNRRHMGVSMFFLAAIHGVFCIIQFHSLGDSNAIVSVFTSNQNYQAVSDFPFQILGFFALMILAFMAATSHDFWLKNLGPVLWKTLHMSVYVAYAMIILHVALGTLQYEENPLYQVILGGGFLMISGLHVYAGWKENIVLRGGDSGHVKDGFVSICDLSEIPEDCAKVVLIQDQNVAIFKYNGKISAVHNVCKHQMGPLGEGRIIDGCITCPWHGYQYHPHNGQSPAPFKEKIKTYKTEIRGTQVWLDPNPMSEGTEVDPAVISNAEDE